MISSEDIFDLAASYRDLSEKYGIDMGAPFRWNDINRCNDEFFRPSLERIGKLWDCGYQNLLAFIRELIDVASRHPSTKGFVSITRNGSEREIESEEIAKFHMLRHLNSVTSAIGKDASFCVINDVFSDADKMCAYEISPDIANAYPKAQFGVSHGCVIDEFGFRLANFIAGSMSSLLRHRDGPEYWWGNELFCRQIFPLLSQDENGRRFDHSILNENQWDEFIPLKIRIKIAEQSLCDHVC